MLKLIKQKRSMQLLLIILIVSVFAFATMAIAAIGKEVIGADSGGTILIDEHAKLIIPAGALSCDTSIKAKIVQNKNKIALHFEPEGIKFNKPIYLQKDLSSVWDAELGYHLYYAPDPDNLDFYTEEIEPEIDQEHVTWSLGHFSIYYYRRR